MKIEKKLSPWDSSHSKIWSRIFLASCVIGVSIDPLFLYIPIINEELKCLDIDQTIKIAAVILRSLTDFTCVVHLILRLKTAISRKILLQSSLLVGFPWFYLIVDILAILPIPQDALNSYNIHGRNKNRAKNCSRSKTLRAPPVIVIKFIYEIAGSSRSLTTRKLMNILLIFQYLPRILRVYISAKDIGRSFDVFTQFVWLKGAFNFFLYIIGCHVFGGLWYFHSILRETACWHHACKKDEAGCIPHHFSCSNPNPIKNLTYIKEFCPVDPSNSTVFDFGIFTDAIESRILGKTEFLRKLFRSFWWGVQTLSSFGQNLETSRSIEENLFAILISILGLLVFLYLVGNLQTYMQLATKKSEKARKRLTKKQPEINLYLSNAPITEDKKKVVKQYVQEKIKEDEDFDCDYLFSLLKKDEHNKQANEVPNNLKAGPAAPLQTPSLGQAIDPNKDSQPKETFSKWITSLQNAKKRIGRKADQRAELWIDKNLPKGLQKDITKYVHLRLQEGKDADIGCENILHILPSVLEVAVKEHLCLKILKKVPLLKNLEESVHKTICNFLKPLTFRDGSYIIRKGEPLDMMLFITQGVVWTFGSSSIPMKRIEKGEYYGDELLEWRINSTSYDDFPISVANLKSHTNVEAFALKADDLDHVLFDCWFVFSHNYSSVPEGLKPFAKKACSRWVRRRMRKRNSVPSQSGEVSVNMH